MFVNHTTKFDKLIDQSNIKENVEEDSIKAFDNIEMW
jgi:hypothetical protein